MPESANPTTKRAQIDKANVVMVAAVAIAAFITIFSLIAIKSLVSRQIYQNKVIEARENARDQLKKNLTEADKLTESYKQFVSSTANVIGGSPTGSGERDGDNARIVLDALPSKYDYPALASSIEKIASTSGVTFSSITGTDDELNQSGASESPQPVEMPFTLAVNGDFGALGNMVGTFEKSIRPFKLSKMTFTGSDNKKIELSVEGKSYYQPEKSLEFKKEVVK